MAKPLTINTKNYLIFGAAALVALNIFAFYVINATAISDVQRKEIVPDSNQDILLQNETGADLFTAAIFTLDIFLLLFLLFLLLRFIFKTIKNSLKK